MARTIGVDVESGANQLVELIVERLATRLEAFKFPASLKHEAAGGEQSLKTSQLANRLGVCEETVRRWRALPGFPAIDISISRPGRKRKPVYRYRLSQVDQWLARRNLRED